MKTDPEFVRPSATYRVKPFWFWNGEINEAELVNQLKEMKAQGIGGVFISARQGMTIPYLSKRWFELVRFACLEANKLGIEAWLYDEYPYPSGMSGGEVILQHPEAKQMRLEHRRFEVAGETPLKFDLGWTQILSAQAYPIVDGRIDWQGAIDLQDDIGNLQVETLFQQAGLTNYTNKRFFSYGPHHVLTATLPSGQWRIEIYTQGPSADFKYFGSFFDPCNLPAVQTFIQTTHEQYRKHVGDLFGDQILGVFADETGFQGPLPWSKELPAFFEARYGYSLLSVLPALHNASYPRATRIRYEFFQAASDLLIQNFHKPIADWCAAQGIKYVTEVPSWRMDTQQYSAVVGGDCAHEKLGKPLPVILDTALKNYRSNAKMVSSLARQLNKPFAMIESFHSVGWTMTLQDAKWMLDRLSSFGINFNVLHAFYYTVADITKYDAAPSQFMQNPYWPYYHLLADYVARMNYLTTNAVVACDVAVLDPVASFWTKLGNTPGGFHYRGDDAGEKARLEPQINEWIGICKTLLAHQVNYDHLDAQLLAKAQVQGATIRLGQASYRAVILPSMDCIEASVLTKLTEFVANGGTVISTGQLPHITIQGTASDQETAQAWARMFKQGTAYSAVDYTSPRFITLCQTVDSKPFVTQVIAGDESEVLITQRRAQAQALIQLVNQGCQPVTVALQLRDHSMMNLVQLDLAQGKTKPFVTQQTSCQVHLAAYASAWYVTDPQASAGLPAVMDTIQVPMAGQWSVQIAGDNVLKLSGWQMQIASHAAVPIVEKTFIEQCVDTQALGGEMIEYHSNFGTPRKLMPKYPLAVHYHTAFTCDQLPKQLRLLKDLHSIAGDHSVVLNGQPIPAESWQMHRFYDQSNQVCDIAQLVHVGENTIDLTVTVTKDSDGLRAPLYLLGQFGVGRGGIVTALPQTAQPDAHWVQGFPYYSGEMTFKKQFTKQALAAAATDQRLTLDFNVPHYDCLRVVINGVDLGVQAYTPYVWQVPAGVIEDHNEVAVTVINSMANMFEGEYFDYTQHATLPIVP